jgi:hypothetical protein
MTGQQIKYIRFLLKKSGLLDQKDEVIQAISDGRTTHMRDLTTAETSSLIDLLSGGDDNPKVKDQMIRKMLSTAHAMGWELPDGKVDLARLNAWCEKYTPSKKPLDKIPYKELPGVVTVFDKVYLSFLKGL